MMTPLEQFICDSCGEMIEKTEDGWVEWLLADDRKAHSFRIVHHDQKCQYDSRRVHVLADDHLTEFLGPDRLANLYRFIDLGQIHDPKGLLSPMARNLKEYMEIVRRLTIPHYEEARLYWDKAERDGFFEGANEIWVYLPNNLKALIREYGED